MGTETEGRDREAGRADSAEALLGRLASSAPGYLSGALENPRFSARHAVQLLRNVRATAEHLSALADRAEVMRAPGVRVGLATHPATPRRTALEALVGLRWRDLVAVCLKATCPAPVRGKAERAVREVFEGLALGEKISLARLAPRGLLPLVARDPHPQIIGALLQNPRLMEPDVQSLLEREGLGAEVLRTVAASARWIALPGLRWALARHPRTPRDVALRCVQGLGRDRLAALARDPRCPPLVRVAAERRLAEGRGA